MVDKPFWTTKELAEQAGVTTGYIRRLLIQGTIYGWKFGRDWQIPDSDAEKYLGSRGKKVESRE